MEKKTLEKLIVNFKQLDNSESLAMVKQDLQKASERVHRQRITFGSDSVDMGEVEAMSEQVAREEGYQKAISTVLRELNALLEVAD